MIAALRYFAAEAVLSLWRGRRASALSILTIGIGLFVLGVFLLATTNLEQLVSRWSSAAEFSVYLRDAVTDSQREAVARKARAHRLVAGVTAVSKAQAVARFDADHSAGELT